MTWKIKPGAQAGPTQPNPTQLNPGVAAVELTDPGWGLGTGGPTGQRV